MVKILCFEDLSMHKHRRQLLLCRDLITDFILWFFFLKCFLNRALTQIRINRKKSICFLSGEKQIVSIECQKVQNQTSQVFFINFNLYQLPKYSVQVSTYPDNLTKRMKYTPDTSKTRVTLSTRSDLKNIISLVCYISELSRVVAPYRGRRYFITTSVSLHC